MQFTTASNLSALTSPRSSPPRASLSDNLTLMRFLEQMEDRSNSSIVGICMGEAGIISRVLGLRAGSAFTFAAATQGEETAPGQIAARTLIETYRIDQVDAATKVYGVAGNPIRSSLSPLMMNTAFRRETVNAVYLALQTAKADDLFKLMREIPIQGLSVTMPLKQDVMPLLERTDPLSAKIGAVNTILRAQDGKFYGFNTDVAGIIGPLERRLSLKDARVLVLGAGGAARAAVFGCRDKGAEVCICNRTPETAHKLARQAGAKTITPRRRRQAQLRRHHQRHAARHDRPRRQEHSRRAARSRRDQRALRLRPGLQPHRDAAAAPGPPEGHRRHLRRGDVRAAGRAPV